MGLIKARAAPPTTVRLHLRDLEADARAHVERAAAEAEQIIADAKERAAQIEANAAEIGRGQGMRAGREEGFAAGRAEAIAGCSEQLQLALGALAHAAQAMDASRAELETVALNDVIRLAVAIAERVTKRQGAIDPTVLRENLRGVMNILVHRDEVCIAIHPSQRDCVNEMLPQLKLEWPELKHAQIVADSAVLPGGCRVTTGMGEVDADLKTQLDRIVAELIPGGGQGWGPGLERGLE
jgi:flagellar assembly protein FliH